MNSIDGTQHSLRPVPLITAKRLVTLPSAVRPWYYVETMPPVLCSLLQSAKLCKHYRCMYHTCTHGACNNAYEYIGIHMYKTTSPEVMLYMYM